MVATETSSLRSVDKHHNPHYPFHIAEKWNVTFGSPERN